MKKCNFNLYNCQKANENSNKTTWKSLWIADSIKTYPNIIKIIFSFMIWCVVQGFDRLLLCNLCFGWRIFYFIGELFRGAFSISFCSFTRSFLVFCESFWVESCRKSFRKLSKLLNKLKMLGNVKAQENLEEISEIS